MTTKVVLICLIAVFAATYLRVSAATEISCLPADAIFDALSADSSRKVVEKSGTIAGTDVSVPANEIWVFRAPATISAAQYLNVYGALIGLSGPSGSAPSLSLNALRISVNGIVATASGRPGADADPRNLISSPRVQMVGTSGLAGGSIHISGPLLLYGSGCIATGDGGAGGSADWSCAASRLAYPLDAARPPTIGAVGGDGAKGGDLLLQGRPSFGMGSPTIYLGNGGRGGNAVLDGASLGSPHYASVSGKGGASGMPAIVGAASSSVILRDSDFTQRVVGGSGLGGAGGDATTDARPRDQCLPVDDSDQCAMGVGQICTKGIPGRGDHVDADAGCDGDAGYHGTDGQNGAPGVSGTNGGQAYAPGNGAGAYALAGGPGYAGGGHGGSATAHAANGCRGGLGGQGGPASGGGYGGSGGYGGDGSQGGQAEARAGSGGTCLAFGYSGDGGDAGAYGGNGGDGGRGGDGGHATDVSHQGYGSLGGSPGVGGPAYPYAGQPGGTYAACLYGAGGQNSGWTGQSGSVGSNGFDNANV